jgi:hypothetical protein
MDNAEKDKEQFDAAYSEIESRENAPSSNEYDKWRYPIAQVLQDRFGEAERDRRPLEMRWIRDLRQTRNEYDPEVLARIHPKRSKAFIGITRTKVKTISARMTDLLFPPSSDKNWGIDPTPVPDLDPNLQAQIVEQITQLAGTPPTTDEIKLILYGEARKRSEAMEKEIEDQLAELKYREIIRNVIRSGNIYGTGILKGPLVREQVTKRWATVNGKWQALELRYLLPYCEHVDLWDVYPDMTARTSDDLRYVFQRHVMTKHKLQMLGERRDFNGDAIKAYIRSMPDGNAEQKNHEEDLRNLASKHGEEQINVPKTTEKFEVLEYWGFVSADDLKEVEGVKLTEDLKGMEVAANIWMIDGIVIKAVISRVEGALIPYHWYYFDKDETCIFGEGIPSIMRDTQRLMNATIRAMIDNAAISAGPIIEANRELLAPGEDPTDLYPFRVFQRIGVGMEATVPAIKVNSLPSYTKEFMGLLDLWMTMADETTAIPRYMSGEMGAVQGAGRTASGLSMLMGAANIVLKDQVRNFDDGITKPFIKAMYNWNMKLNGKPEIKGDFSISAKGSTSLIAKEVRAESIIQFLNITNNPTDLAITNRDKVLTEYAKALDLSSLDLIKPPPQVKVEGEQASQVAEADKAFTKELAMLKAQSGGHMGPEMSSGGNPGGLPPIEQLTDKQMQEGQIPEVGYGQ